MIKADIWKGRELTIDGIRCVGSFKMFEGSFSVEVNPNMTAEEYAHEKRRAMDEQAACLYGWTFFHQNLFETVIKAFSSEEPLLISRPGKPTMKMLPVECNTLNDDDKINFSLIEHPENIR